MKAWFAACSLCGRMYWWFDEGLMFSAFHCEDEQCRTANNGNRNLVYDSALPDSYPVFRVEIGDA